MSSCDWKKGSEIKLKKKKKKKKKNRAKTMQSLVRGTLKVLFFAETLHFKTQNAKCYMNDPKSF